jgi:hypothetical protein
VAYFTHAVGQIVCRVRFLQAHGCWPAGAEAGLSQAEAAALVKRGLAQEVLRQRKTEEGKWETLDTPQEAPPADDSSAPPPPEGPEPPQLREKNPKKRKRRGRRSAYVAAGDNEE